MMVFWAQFQSIHRVGLPVWGIVIPALVFIFSFGITWLLYKHFSKELHQDKK